MPAFSAALPVRTSSTSAPLPVFSLLGVQIPNRDAELDATARHDGQLARQRSLLVDQLHHVTRDAGREIGGLARQRLGPLLRMPRWDRLLPRRRRRSRACRCQRRRNDEELPHEHCLP